tara:strand:+ start:315 stop:1037 length:723 start_codon:yes stop_codon:yes gene_type:complete
MRKLNYLIEMNSNAYLLKSYLIHSFILKIKKKKRKEFIKNYKTFLKEKKITYDFFSRNIFDWYNVLDDFKNEKFKYLEIGSFEGNSALFMIKYFKNSSLVCVDQWRQLYETDGKREGYEHLPIASVEKNFDDNLKNYTNRFVKKKTSADLFFAKNNELFDIIFVDGSHYAKDVWNDCLNSWSILRKYGILILDDYFWRGYEDLQDNPAFAINKFLKKIKNEYEVIKLTKFQLFLRKLSNN